MAVNIQNFLTQKGVVWSYKENSLRGMIIEGAMASADGLSLPGVVDGTQATPIYAGDPLSVVATSTGTTRVVKATADTKVIGFASYQTKQVRYRAEDVLNISSTGVVMQMIATEALTAGQKVALDFTDEANIIVKPAAEGDTVIGVTEENTPAAADGILVGVRITVPFTVA